MAVHTLLQQRTIPELAQLLYQRKKIAKPPVLLVGAGMSMDSGGPSGEGLMTSIVSAYLPPFDDWVEGVNDKLSAKSIPDAKLASIARALCHLFENRKPFPEMPEEGRPLEPKDIVPFLYSRTISRRSVQELYEVFDAYLQYNRPSEGYALFARLARRGYFEWIISTNFDPLVEEALVASGMPNHDLITFARRVTHPDEIAKFIGNNFRVPRIKLLKIHGDLKTRVVDAIGESVQKFQPDEKRLAAAVVDLIRERDLIVIGHSLGDGAINGLIERAYARNIGGKQKRNKQRLNSLWLTTMSRRHATEKRNEVGRLIGKLEAMHKTAKNGAVSLLVPPSGEHCCTSAADDEQYYFDGLMRDLTAELSRLENDSEYAQAKPLAAFDKIVFACGMTVSKNQLLRLVVAPQHLSTRGVRAHIDIDHPSIINLHDVKFSNAVAPIYFPSIMDGLALQVLNEGLRRNRATTSVLPVASDFPMVRSLFIRDVCLRSAGKSDLTKIKPPPHQKGIRTLSYYLFEALGKKLKTHKKKPGDLELKLFIDCEIDAEERRFLTDGQKYAEVGDAGADASAADKQRKAIQRILETLVMIGGHRDHIKIMANEKDADLVLSLGQSPQPGALPIPIHRFVPILDESTRLWEMLHEHGPGAADPRNRLFLTAGGPEHNKILELFIALHRWTDGESIMNQSNYFDRSEIEEKQLASTVSLYSESYVGGVAVRRAGGATEMNEQNRGGFGAFVVNFGFATKFLPGALAEAAEEPRTMQVLAVVGLTAPGTMLGLAYVAFHTNYVVQRDLVRLIDIPKTQKVPLAIGGASPEIKSFVEAYVAYLRGDAQTCDESAAAAFKRAGNKPPTKFRAQPIMIEQLLSPVEEGFRAWMRMIGLKFDELGAYDCHGRLWSLVADRYLVKQP